MVAWSGRRSKSEPAYSALEAAKIPIIPTPTRLAAAMSRLTRFAMDRNKFLARPAGATARSNTLRLPRKLVSGRTALSEIESKELLAAAGIPVTREVLVRPGGDAVAEAGRLRPPFAVKIVSADIAHKSDIGGVRLGVGTHAELAAAVAEVTQRARAAAPKAHIDGVIVAEMARGVEVLIGVVNDASFGPAVALGLGGVAAEVLKDVVYRIAPFDLETACEMVGELRGAALLHGHRGSPSADIEALAHALVRVSDLACAMREGLAELDINPVFVAPAGQGVVAADALAVLKPTPGA
jgi:acetyltransferase